MRSIGKIKVVIADDHEVVREGLKILIQEDPGIVVAGEARTGRDAVQLANELQPDVVLMDIVMPGMNGLEATKQIVATYSRSKVLVLSSYSGDEVVRDLLRAGAAGYLTKQSASAELLQAIREVHSGRPYFSPSIARRFRKLNRGRTGQQEPRAVRLSQRETQVLRLIAGGLPNKQIADVLGISIKTVEKHRQQLIDKLDIHDTAGLTRYAVDVGLVPATPTPSSSVGSPDSQAPVSA